MLIGTINHKIIIKLKQNSLVRVKLIMPKQVLATKCCSCTSWYKATASRRDAPNSMDIVMEGEGVV